MCTLRKAAAARAVFPVLKNKAAAPLPCAERFRAGLLCLSAVRVHLTFLQKHGNVKRHCGAAALNLMEGEKEDDGGFYRAGHTGQRLSVELGAAGPAGRHRVVFHAAPALCAGAPLWRRHAAAVRRVQPARQGCRQGRHELVPGADDGCRGPGRHRQHHGLRDRAGQRRAGGAVLGVGIGVSGHGDDLCRSRAGAEIQDHR